MTRPSPFQALDAVSGPVLTTAARLIFAATLLTYYLNSGLQKLGEGLAGLVQPSASAYVTIFPRAFEAVGYDASQFGVFHWAVAFAGTWAEIILPVLIVAGLLTRLAALGMIGFVIVQSWVDIVGHGLAAADIGAWFDRLPTAAILDQRAFWVFLLLVLVMRGGGPLSLDRLLFGAPAQDRSAARTASVQPR
ncbi:MAG: DoxX family protein [Paracoccaceae bacterium]|nr:DoxX family protein [Paracoccaceae bacterium]